MSYCATCARATGTCSCGCSVPIRVVVPRSASAPNACPSCGGDVRRCTCARSITALPTGTTLTGTESATLSRWCRNTPAPLPMNRAQRRARR
jgi:hypothetical protein